MSDQEALILTDSKGVELMTIPKVKGIYFNVSYEARRKLYDSDRATLVQWMTISDISVNETIKLMRFYQLKKLKQIIRDQTESQRGKEVIYFINVHLDHIKD